MEFWIQLLSLLNKLIPWIHQKKLCLLVIEDNSNDSLLMAEHIESLGYTCEIANSCEQALGLMAAKNFPAVFIDCRMPRMSGMTFHRIARDRWPRTRLVMTPAEISDLGELPPGEFICFIRKPVTAHSIKRAMRKR